MQKIKIASIVLSVIFLAGCTISGSKNKTSQAGSLWRTSDGGHTFEVKSKINDETYITKADILSISYHPKTQNTIYVSSVDNGIFKTIDGGERWESIVFPPKKIYSFFVDKADPDNKMFASGVINGWGKILRTVDGGKEWKEVYTEPGEKTTVTALAQHPRENNIIFAGTSNGTVVKSLDAGDTWKNIGSKIDSIVANFSFDSVDNASVFLLEYGRKLYHSKNGGEVWLSWEDEKVKEVQKLRDQAGEAAKNGNNKLADSLNEKAKKLDERNKENKMPNDIISIVVDPSISGTIYAGTKKGFFVSRDFGKYWYELNIIESAKSFSIRSIAVNPKNSKEIVFVAGKAFYKSSNGGETWEVTGINTSRQAFFVSYDPFDSNFLFIGLRSSN